MEQRLEELLKGLAFSNFYFHFDREGDPTELIVAEYKGLVNIGPDKGFLRFECGQGASARTVTSLASDKPGVIRIYPPLELTCGHKYLVHQNRTTFPSVAIEIISVREYQKLAGKR